jgi:DNA-binding CsgD family transcriptional regulator
MADCLYLSSQVALSLGDAATARSLAEESIALSREIGDREGLSESLPLLARILAVQGDVARARTLYEESLAVARETGNKMNIAICLEGLADMAVAQGVVDPSVSGVQSTALSSLWAAQLWGAAESLREAIGAPMPPVDRVPYERAVATARARLGEQAFARAWAKGKAMPLAEALAAPTKAKDAAPAGQTRASSTRAPTYPDELTAREVEILRLVAQGWTDAQIAAYLVISIRTVNTHVTSIYRKIQVTGRSAATRYAVEHQIV